MGFITEPRETIRANAFVFFSGPTNVIRILYQWSSMLLCRFHQRNEVLMNPFSSDKAFSSQLFYGRVTGKNLNKYG